MNAPPNIGLVSAHSGSDDVVNWLTNETRDERFLDNIFAELCVRLQRANIPVKRATLHILIHHPQWLGARFVWADGMREAEIARIDYDVRERSEYIASPASEIHEGAAEVRENLERDPSLGRKHAIYGEMRAKGLTDYVAWPFYHTLGKRHIVTFATDRPGGFEDAHIAALSQLLPVLALVSEIRVKNRLARTLLETYVGSHASELILAGATRRGTGTTVRAAILICDLRDFTRISDNWPRDDVIDLLNGYFDAMSEPIERHGGEILKFIGDGLLAIFPLSEPSACANLLRADITGNGLPIRRGHEVEVGAGAQRPVLDGEDEAAQSAAREDVADLAGFRVHRARDLFGDQTTRVPGKIPQQRCRKQRKQKQIDQRQAERRGAYELAECRHNYLPNLSAAPAGAGHPSLRIYM
jgi:adenylate cyclase